MTSEEMKTERDQEVQRIGTGLCFETLTKIQIRIGDIRRYYGHFQNVKKFLPDNESDLVYRVYFVTLATLYRSLFKGLDKRGGKGFKIDVEKFGITDDEVAYHNHLSLINIVDKDLAHLDKNSKSHRVLDVKTFKDTKSTTMVTSAISEDQMKVTINFLSLILEPAIQEATSIAQAR